jgi:hypothetical protein
MKTTLKFSRKTLERVRNEVMKKWEHARVQYIMETWMDFEESVRWLMKYKKKDLAELIVNCYILEQSEFVKDYMRNAFRKF